MRDGFQLVVQEQLGGHQNELENVDETQNRFQEETIQRHISIALVLVNSIAKEQRAEDIVQVPGGCVIMGFYFLLVPIRVGHAEEWELGFSTNLRCFEDLPACHSNTHQLEINQQFICCVVQEIQKTHNRKE